MKRTISIMMALLAGTVVGAATAADAPAYPNTSGIGDVASADTWYRQCLRVEKAAPPAKDLPAPASDAALKNCNAQELYYDTKNQSGATASDWQNVRHCAIAKGDAGVLMMLYANGMGVARNLDLALKYACSVDGARMEMSGRVEHLTELSKTGSHAVLDLCDDITSGYMQGVCTAIAERQSGKKRTRQLDSLVKGWTPPQKAALDKLQSALDGFAGARGDKETDVSGTARAAMAIAAQAAEVEQFAQDIRSFEKGKMPRFTAAEFADQDQKLNAIYQKIMGLPAKGPTSLSTYGTVTKEEIKFTQRTWLKYRDAFVGMGAARYPAVEAHAWKALLTQRRVKQLAEFTPD